jgi:hypothetical protein
MRNDCFLRKLEGPFGGSSFYANGGAYDSFYANGGAYDASPIPQPLYNPRSRYPRLSSEHARSVVQSCDLNF